MNQTYRIVGWMTELERGLTVEEWQEIMNRLNPELEYLPFEASAENSSIYALIDQVLVEECDDELDNLKAELEELCANWMNESDLHEYPVLGGEVAYVGCSAISLYDVSDLSNVESFEAFAEIQELEMDLTLISFESWGKTYEVVLTNDRGQALEIPDFFVGSEFGELTIAYILNHIAEDLVLYKTEEYLALGWEESKIESFLNDIRQYYIFTCEEERDALIRLLED